MALSYERVEVQKTPCTMHVLCLECVHVLYYSCTRAVELVRLYMCTCMKVSHACDVYVVCLLCNAWFYPMTKVEFRKSYTYLAAAYHVVSVY